MITLKKIKVFISHKRTEGQASTEAILIKEALDKKKVYDSFMDVREDYIGNFPTVLQNKIKECDVFIIVFTGDKADYLQDEKPDWQRSKNAKKSQNRRWSGPGYDLALEMLNDLSLEELQELLELSSENYVHTSEEMLVRGTHKQIVLK